MYDIIPKEKPATSNVQTSDGANNNKTPTKSAITIMTTADAAEKNQTLRDALAESAKQNKVNEKPAPTETPTNIAQAEDVKKHR